MQVADHYERVRFPRPEDGGKEAGLGFSGIVGGRTRRKMLPARGPARLEKSPELFQNQGHDSRERQTIFPACSRTYGKERSRMCRRPGGRAQKRGGFCPELQPPVGICMGGRVPPCLANTASETEGGSRGYGGSIPV